jgi:WD40 repeat protein
MMFKKEEDEGKYKRQAVPKYLSIFFIVIKRIIKMKKTTKTISLIILFVLCIFNANYSFSEEKSTTRGRWNRLEQIYFIPQQDLIVGACSSGDKGSIRFWSIDDGKLKNIIDLGEGVWADSIAVSNDGRFIVAALLGKNETACYSLTEKKWLWKVKWLDKGVIGNSMLFTPDDRNVVVVGFRNIVTYDAKTGAIVQRQEDSDGFSAGFPNYRTRNNAISPSAKYATFFQGNLEHDEGWWSSRNIWVVVRDIEKEKTIAKQGKIQEKYKNCSAVFTPDEKNLVLGSMDGYIKVWSIAEQKVIREWEAYEAGKPSVPLKKNPSPNLIQAMTFSSDGRYLATLNLFGSIKIWDYSTSKLLHEFFDVISSSFPMCSGYPMTFSPDGKSFAFEQQGKLCLYDTQTWKEKWCVLSWPEADK